MTSLKFHYSKPTFSDPGWASPDYRGDKRIGGSEGDHHGTGGEIDPFDLSGADNVLGTILEAAGVEIVEGVDLSGIGEQFVLKLLADMNKSSVKEVQPGVYMGVRAGLWDGDGRV